MPSSKKETLYIFFLGKHVNGVVDIDFRFTVKRRCRHVEDLRVGYMLKALGCRPVGAD
jgi:hypothetical protein